jgi:hypothetical protein
MMNETVGIDDEGHPVSCHERKARILDRDLRGRTSSGPAARRPRQKAGPQTAETFRTSEKPLANRGRPHMTKKTAAQDEGEAFVTGLVMTFSIFEGGLFQT